jgi:hypothetical protein
MPRGSVSTILLKLRDLLPFDHGNSPPENMHDKETKKMSIAIQPGFHAWGIPSMAPNRP